MAAAPCLILYGNSVFLAGIKAELERRVALELVTVEAGCLELTDLIRLRRPQAVIFDLAMTQPDFALTLRGIVPLLRAQPGLLLVGVDPSNDELLVLSSRPAQALSVADLVNVIKTDFTRKKDSSSETFQGNNHEKNDPG